MSRTDAHKPWWAGRDWEPVHSIWCQNHVPRRKYQKVGPYEPCTLPEEPPSGRGLSPRTIRRGECIWERVSPYAYPRFMYPYWRLFGRPRRWSRNINLYGNGPMRAGEHGAARRFIAEWRGSGDSDVEWPDGRHRHNVEWLLD